MASKSYELAVKIAGKLDSSFKNATGGAQRQLANLGNTAKKLGGILAGTAGIASVGAFVSDAVRTYKDFGAAMSATAATAGASADEYAKLEAAARKMGQATTKTATEASEALGYMALAGWDVDTSIAALPSVLHLSEATAMDLATASDLTTDSLSALGLTVKDLPRYLDVAAKANNKSNQSAQQLMEAYLTVGGTMNNLHVPIEESATALGVLANRGTKGSEAGTALNAIVNNLTTGTGKAGKMMNKLGISAFNSEGKFIGLTATLQKVDAATKGLTEEERNAALAAIGGKEHIKSLNALLSGLNTTTADGTTEWAALRQELNQADGALDTMAAQMTDNFAGASARFGSAMDEMKLSLMDAVGPAMTKAVDYLAAYTIPGITDAMRGGITWIQQNFAPAMAAIGEFFSPMTQAAVMLGGQFQSALAPAKQLLDKLSGMGNLALQGLMGLAQEAMPYIATGMISVGNAITQVVNFTMPYLLQLADQLHTIVPPILNAAKVVGTRLLPVFQTAGRIISGIIVPTITAAVELIAPKIITVVGKIAPAITAILNVVGPLVSVFAARLQIIISTVAGVFQGVFSTISGVVGNIINALGGVLDFITGVFTGNWSLAWQGVVDMFGGIFGGLAGIAKVPINAVLGVINGAINGINSISFTVPEWVPGLGGKTFGGFGIPNIPYLAEGGITTGPTLAMIGEGQEDEAVLPLSKLSALLHGEGGAGGDIVFAPTIKIQGNADEKAVMRVMDTAYQEFKAFMQRYEQERKRVRFG